MRFLDGITILNEVKNVTNSMPVAIILTVCGFILMGVSIYTIYLMIVERDYSALFLPFIGIIVSVMAFIVANLKMNETPYTSYEVTISDEVSFKDFTNKYEVIEQRGEIYVVRER